MPNSYEHSYQHDLDNVIDVSNAVLAIGTEKINTTTLNDRSLNNNDATIHGAMPSGGYFLGRRFTAANSNYLDCGNDSSLDITDEITIEVLARIRSDVSGRLLSKHGGSSYGWILARTDVSENIEWRISKTGSDWNGGLTAANTFEINNLYFLTATYDGNYMRVYINGVEDTSEDFPHALTGNMNIAPASTQIGRDEQSGDTNSFDGIIIFSCINGIALSESATKQHFNSLARLSLYSHNFERYQNSDTSLTSVFPYTSGIIISGTFNKTDGLKCTSAGTIVFSNNHEFDGSEYITLTIDGVEYSGTTTVTQGTITATIAQSSNDITIEMGTNAVLEDIQIQFRVEV